MREISGAVVRLARQRAPSLQYQPRYAEPNQAETERLIAVELANLGHHRSTLFTATTLVRLARLTVSFPTARRSLMTRFRV